MEAAISDVPKFFKWAVISVARKLWLTIWVSISSASAHLRIMPQAFA
jgi:hypothetical protein